MLKINALAIQVGMMLAEYYCAPDVTSLVRPAVEEQMEDKLLNA